MNQEIEEIKFFKAKHILREEFKKYHKINDNWVISLQSGVNFKRMQGLFKNEALQDQDDGQNGSCHQIT